MNKSEAGELISQNLSAFYGYAFDKLYDKDMAQDLAQEIICEILSSVERLKNDEAFWGYAWKIAENTFRKYIRRSRLVAQSLNEKIEYGGFYISPMDERIEKEEKDEELYLIRRELSLLTSVHRSIAVSYYIHNKNCSQIAKEQNMSVEMVKYYLFKSRKILKEGVSVTRKLGEKSYNPGIFRVDYWGDSTNAYEPLFKRKLPGSIVLATYYEPLTIEALSLELGVSVPYLEDELEILESAGILVKNGSKYQTDIVIFTNEYESMLLKITGNCYKNIANELCENVRGLLPKIRALDFVSKPEDENGLLWMAMTICFFEASQRLDKELPLRPLQPLKLGGNGMVFGYDNDYEHQPFNGCTNFSDDETHFYYSNYRAIENVQKLPYDNFWKRQRIMSDAILEKRADESNPVLPDMIERGVVACENGMLKPLFPVFTSKAYGELCELLSQGINMVIDCMINVCKRAVSLFEDVVPPRLKDKARDIGIMHHSTNVSAYITEELIRNSLLKLPSRQCNLTIFGIKK